MSEIHWLATIAALETRVAKLTAGHCVKCNAGPMRESCAYPEACDHPGVKLALIYNQSLLTTAFQNGQIRDLNAHIQTLEAALRHVFDGGSLCEDSNMLYYWENGQSIDIGITITTPTSEEPR